MTAEEQTGEYMGKLNQALARIRKPPEPPSPTVEFDYKGGIKRGRIVWKEDLKQFVIIEGNDFFPLKGFDFPKGGGVLVYWDGLPFPTKVFPYKETVEKIDDAKKVTMACVRSYTGALKVHPILVIIGSFLLRKQLEITALNLLQEISQILRDVENEPKMYSPVGRELYRVFALKEGKVRNQVRELFCHTVDYDDFYRYLFQDVIVKLDKERLKKNTVKEIQHLISIIDQKCIEPSGTMSGKWRRLHLVAYYLYFNKKLRREVRDFLLSLDLKKMKMDKIDIIHATKKLDVKWSWLKEPGETIVG